MISDEMTRANPVHGLGECAQFSSLSDVSGSAFISQIPNYMYFFSPKVKYIKLRKSFMVQISMDIAAAAVVMLTDNNV